MGREHFINADFDLSLRRGKLPGSGSASARQASELPWHFVLSARNGDSILLDREIDPDLAHYFEEIGFEQPAVSVMPSICKRATLTPFGWNREATELNARYLEKAQHPSLEVVRRVNGRRFSADVERLWGDQTEILGVLGSVDEVGASLAERPPDETEWMVKSEYGNAGLGNRRLRSRLLSEADRKVIGRLLHESSWVVLERFRTRVFDLASVFEILQNGSLRGLKIHEVVNTADGAFIGAVFDRESEMIASWKEQISRAMEIVGHRLAESGYFGPACVDSFVWTGGGRLHLRPIVDINARGSMSNPGRCVWQEWGRDRVVYWRLFSARKLRLPKLCDDLRALLAEDAFDPARRCGVLLTSPLQIGGARPLRYGVLLAGMDRAEVEGLDRRFRGTFEK